MSIARSVGRNAVHTAFGRYSVLLVWLLVTPRVLEALGAERFGFWSVLLVISGSLATVDLGLGVAVTRYVAATAGAGSTASGRSVVVRAFVLQVLVAGLLALGLLLARDSILSGFRVPAEWRDEARAAYVFALGGFVTILTGNLFAAALQGLQRMDLAARVAMPLALALFIGVLFAVNAAQPLLAVTRVQFAYGVALALGLGAAVALCLRGDDADVAAPAAHVRMRDLLGLGGWIQFNAILGLVQAQIDKILLGTLVALAPVAAYEIGFRVTVAALLPPYMFLSALLPAAARHEATAGADGRIAFHRTALPPYFALCCALGGALVALAAPLLEAWLGRPPADAALFLRAIAVAQLGNLVGGVASILVRAGGAVRIESAYAVLGTVLHVGLSLLGLRWLGPAGVLLGTAVGSVLAVGWYVVEVERWLGPAARGESLRAILPALAATVLAGLGAAATAAAFGGMAPGRGRGFVALAAGGIVFALVFGGVLAILFPRTFGELRTRALRLVGP